MGNLTFREGTKVRFTKAYEPLGIRVGYIVTVKGLWQHNSVLIEGIPGYAFDKSFFELTEWTQIDL